MLEVQAYLRRGNTLAQLNEELSIKIKEHPTDPLVILDYDQIASPRKHPITRECRGLVLEKGTWNVVAKSFNRFFNLGEFPEEEHLFDWKHCTTMEKVDGSLIILYYYGGRWRINTRFSWADGMVGTSPYTWTELFELALGRKLDEIGEAPYLPRDTSYVFELVSPYNKVVRYYKEPKLYLLTAFHRSEGMSFPESTMAVLDVTAQVIGCSLPKRYPLTTKKEVKAFVRSLEDDDPTDEGVVVADPDGRRWKIKNAKYLTLHQMRGDSDNLYHPKYLLPWILSGETYELLTYFPEVEETLKKYEALVSLHEIAMKAVWSAACREKIQKNFALTIKDQTPFTSLLFSLRNETGPILDIDNDYEDSVSRLSELWRNSNDLIMKMLFKDKGYAAE